MEEKFLIDFLRSNNTNWGSRDHTVVEIPFQVVPDEYLSFAEKDIQDDNNHNLINALSNAKRAMDCQIDSLLFVFGLYTISKRKNWSIPKKMEVLQKLGILTPRILGKINKKRNMMEHDFILPDKEQVVDFIDVIALFLTSTRIFIYDFPGDCQIEEFPENDGYWLDIKYRNQAGFVVEVRKTGEGTVGKFEIEPNDDFQFYIRFMRCYLSKFVPFPISLEEV